MKSRKYVIKQQKTKGHYAGCCFLNTVYCQALHWRSILCTARCSNVHRPMHNSASSYAANRSRQSLKESTDKCNIRTDLKKWQPNSHWSFSKLSADSTGRHFPDVFLRGHHLQWLVPHHVPTATVVRHVPD